MVADYRICMTARDRFNPPYAGCYSRLSRNLKKADLRSRFNMRPAAQLFRKAVIKRNDAHIVSIFFAEQSGHTTGNGFLIWNHPLLFQQNVFADLLIDDVFNLLNFFVGYFSEMG